MVIKNKKDVGIACIYGIEKDGKIEYHIADGGEFDPVHKESRDVVTTNSKAVNYLNEIFAKHGNQSSSYAVALQQAKEKQMKALQQEKEEQMKYMRVTKDGYSYSSTSKGIVYEGSVSLINRADLLPQIYKVKDQEGLYCGSKYMGNIYNSVSMARRYAVQKMVIEESICQDLLAQGRSLTELENSFMKNHKKELSEYGFSVVDGKLKQNDPDQQLAVGYAVRKKVNAPISQQTTAKARNSFVRSNQGMSL